MALRNKRDPSRLAWLAEDQRGETILVAEQRKTGHREHAAEWEPATSSETELLRRTIWE